jgi:hypothetical protein
VKIETTADAINGISRVTVPAAEIEPALIGTAVLIQAVEQGEHLVAIDQQPIRVLLHKHRERLNWDICRLARSDLRFPELRHLRIAQIRPEDHNRTIVGETYDEDGILGSLAATAPVLETLVSPSAPSRNFFDAPLIELTSLAVNAGYDTNDFIDHLTHLCPPSLRSLAWGEYAETYADDWTVHTTPFSSMVNLLESPAFGGLRSFVLKNPTYSDEELCRLAALRPHLQFKIVRTSSAYCSSRTRPDLRTLT